MFMVNLLNPKLCFLQFIIRVLCLFLQIFSKAILKKKMRLFFVETTRVISLPFLDTVACTTRDRQYDVYSTNSICLLLIIAAVGVDGNISLEENWNNKHWTKTTGNRQYRRMITVTWLQFITIGWRSINSEAEKCWL